jgi:uncharacterized heparinase superfamily protein
MMQVGRYLRTVRHLRPEQVVHRVRLRSQKAVLSRFPAIGRRLTLPIPETWGWPEGFVPLDAQMPYEPGVAEAIAEGRFTFLNVERTLGSPEDWQQADAEQLWRFNLHYFEWAWHLARHPDHEWAAGVFERLFRSWEASNPVGRWDAWSPYVTSLRAWALCGVHRQLWAGRPIEHEVVRSLALHAGYLRWHLERDVGGNHLIKNLKALVGLGEFLRSRGWSNRGYVELRREINEQVLADGGHYERSPSYHAQVLGDLLDAARLGAATGRSELSDALPVIDAMRAWLGDMLLPDGDVPHFNDGEVLGEPRLLLLEPFARRQDVVHLASSGYVVVCPDRRSRMVLDVGHPCPSKLPAHAHAGTLSLALSSGDDRLIVNSGTSSYQDVGRRAFERSTAAHSTVEVDNKNSTEVWGLFRAGRRANPGTLDITTSTGVVVITASHDGYRHLRARQYTLGE